jgi:hypothetical protein
MFAHKWILSTDEKGSTCVDVADDLMVWTAHHYLYHIRYRVIKCAIRSDVLPWRYVSSPVHVAPVKGVETLAADYGWRNIRGTLT